METEKTNGFNKTVHDYYETTEKGHGRVETRRYWITDKVKWIHAREEWKGLKSIGMVESERYVKGKTSCETRYFICSLARDAKKFAQAVRQHWTVENNLHWQLDVTFNEDKLRMRVNNAAQNLGVVRRMVLNVLKLEKSKTSMKGKRLKASFSTDYLTKLLAILFNF